MKPTATADFIDCVADEYERKVMVCPYDAPVDTLLRDCERHVGYHGKCTKAVVDDWSKMVE